MTDKKPSQMTFTEFAESMRPRGAINRFPGVGAAADVLTYSVYMNGPMAQTLPRHAQEHTFKDVTLQALTEKLKLNPLSARDNLKVAELVSLRSAWMSSVLETTLTRGENAARILEDFAALSGGMNHPWIRQQVDTQRELSAKLGPTLARAGVDKDIVPKEVSVGEVVAQNSDFTLQRTQDGEVVTHENRRLQAIPAVGEAVMVSYYRGSGQVVDSLDKVKFSDPFVDRDSEDLAVRVTSEKGETPQLVLFNSVQSFDQFVKAHGLDERLVQRAFEARAARPKSEYTAPPREPLGPPYIDDKSGCLALDYVEENVTYTTLFESAQAMADRAAQFGLGAKFVGEGFRLEETMLEMSRMAHEKHAPLVESAMEGVAIAESTDHWVQIDSERDEKDSEIDIRAQLSVLGFAFPQKPEGERQYMGPIVAASPLHVAQDVGRRQIVIHDVRNLDKVPAVGDRLNIRAKDGKGVVTDMVKAQDKDLGR